MLQGTDTLVRNYTNQEAAISAAIYEALKLHLLIRQMDANQKLWRDADMMAL